MRQNRLFSSVAGNNSTLFTLPYPRVFETVFKKRLYLSSDGDFKPFQSTGICIRGICSSSSPVHARRVNAQASDSTPPNFKQFLNVLNTALGERSPFRSSVAYS